MHFIGILCNKNLDACLFLALFNLKYLNKMQCTLLPSDVIELLSRLPLKSVECTCIQPSLSLNFVGPAKLSGYRGPSSSD